MQWEGVHFSFALLVIVTHSPSLKRPHWSTFLLLSISERQFMYSILQSRPRQNRLIWGRRMPCVWHVSDDCFQRTSETDRPILLCSDSLSILAAVACAFSLCHQARDWFLSPSCLPFPLCFKAQIRQAYDVLMHVPWIILLKDGSAQKCLMERVDSVSTCSCSIIAVQGTSSCDVSQRWGKCMAAKLHRH